jgi:TRAP-type transport system periplasmic protein
MLPKQILYGSIWPAHHVFAELETKLMLALETIGAWKAKICRYVDEAEMMSDVQSGKLHFAATSEIQSSIPEAALMYLPYLYRDAAHFKRIWTLDGNDVVRRIESLIRAKADLEPLGYSIVGARDCILIEKPIEQLADFADLIIRVDEAAISSHIFSALGAKPMQVPFYEVEQALATRSVLAAENAPFNMTALGWHTNCKFVSRTEHRFLLNFEVASGSFWNSLDSRIRVSILEAFTAHLSVFANRADVERRTTLDLLVDTHGLAVNNLSPTQRHELEVATKSVIDDYAAQYGLETEIDWIRRQ